MAVPECVSEFLKEFESVHGRPVADAGLVSRMRTEATTWINAAHMQHRRVSHPPLDPATAGNDAWGQAVDIHFLVIALTRLRRAVGLATRVEAIQDALIDHLVEFDESVPGLTTLRNVAEHFDDYTAGYGRNKGVRRHQLQVWSLDHDAVHGLVWR